MFGSWLSETGAASLASSLRSGEATTVGSWLIKFGAAAWAWSVGSVGAAICCSWLVESAAAAKSGLSAQMQQIS